MRYTTPKRFKKTNFGLVTRHIFTINITKKETQSKRLPMVWSQKSPSFTWVWALLGFDSRFLCYVSFLFFPKSTATHMNHMKCACAVFTLLLVVHWSKIWNTSMWELSRGRHHRHPIFSRVGEVLPQLPRHLNLSLSPYHPESFDRIVKNKLPGKLYFFFDPSEVPL